MEDRAPATSGRQFRHEALFYEGASEFLAGTVPFLRAGLAADEPILVALDERKIRLLRDELGADADRVRFVDMAALGRNPACIIPAWRDFVADRQDGSPIRGIGEPVWRGRSEAELSECDHHESLLNLAFADAADFTLLCPYDVEGLDPDVLEAARRNHPLVTAGGETTPSAPISARRQPRARSTARWRNRRSSPPSFRSRAGTWARSGASSGLARRRRAWTRRGRRTWRWR